MRADDARRISARAIMSATLCPKQFTMIRKLDTLLLFVWLICCCCWHGPANCQDLKPAEPPGLPESYKSWSVGFSAKLKMSSQNDEFKLLVDTQTSALAVVGKDQCVAAHCPEHLYTVVPAFVKIPTCAMKSLTLGPKPVACYKENLDFNELNLLNRTVAVTSIQNDLQNAYQNIVLDGTLGLLDGESSFLHSLLGLPKPPDPLVTTTSKPTTINVPTNTGRAISIKATKAPGISFWRQVEVRADNQTQTIRNSTFENRGDDTLPVRKIGLALGSKPKLALGGVDTAAFEGDLIYTKLFESLGLFVRFDRIVLRHKSRNNVSLILCESNCLTRIDSAFAPTTRLIDSKWSDIENYLCQDWSESRPISPTTARYETHILEAWTGDVSKTQFEFFSTLDYSAPDQAGCFPHIHPIMTRDAQTESGEGLEMILGQDFLKYNYLAVDYEAKSVGFAPLVASAA